MRRVWLILTIIVLAYVLACVPSLHQLYTDDILTYEPALLGSWISQDSKDTCTISQAGDSVYDIVYSQEGIPAKFEGHLVSLDSNLFLDTYPEEPAMENDFYKAHIILAHIISKISVQGDSLEFAVLDDDWLGEQLDYGKTNIGHENVEGNIILTASTAELQDFITVNADSEDAFPNPATYFRKH